MVGRAMQQLAHEIERELVGPVHVVEQEHGRPLAADLLEQCGVHDGERHVLLVLRGAALHHPQAAAVSRLSHGIEQRALADPGLAEDGHRADRAVENGVQRALHGVQLSIAADQLHEDHRRATPGGYSSSRGGATAGVSANPWLDFPENVMAC